MSTLQITSGIWPAMITPLNPDQSVNWDQLEQITDWYIESGVHGLFAVGQSGEMFALSNEERLEMARRVVERAAGRVQVVATGTFGGPIEEQAAFVRQMATTGVDAVTVIMSELAQEDAGEDVWKRNAEQLLALTDDIPLALYECPQPYHRLISPELLGWAAKTGRFYMMKETSRSIDLVKAKVEATAGTPLKVFNADTTGLLDSLRVGAHGYCGIAANYYPDLVVWLYENHKADSDTLARVQAFIQTADPTIHNKYPVAAKYYRREQGFPMETISRLTDAEIGPYDTRVLKAIAYQAADVRASLNGNHS